MGVGEIELKVRDGLYGFPANLTLSENNADGFKYSQVASSAGRDLRFTDSTEAPSLPTRSMSGHQAEIHAYG